MLGNIFKDKFNVDASKLSLKEINKIAIKKVKFLTYGENIVSKTGNIFKNKSYGNINKTIDEKLNFYNISK